MNLAKNKRIIRKSSTYKEKTSSDSKISPLLKKYQTWIKKRRQKKSPALTFTPDLKNSKDLAAILAAGGLVVIPWGSLERQIYCLIGCFDIPNVTKLMNEAKGRTSNQALAVGCLPHHIPSIAEVESSVPLKNAMNNLNETDLINFLTRCFDRSIGLVFKAKSHLSQEVTITTQIGRTIMIAGEKPLDSENDIYNQTLHELYESYGKVIAGTSANPSSGTVFSIFDQDEAYKTLKLKVDAFVKHDKPLQKPSDKLYITSSTIIDLTSEKPIVIRWGNLHPDKFKDIFADLIIPENVTKNPNADDSINP